MPEQSLLKHIASLDIDLDAAVCSAQAIHYIKFTSADRNVATLLIKAPKWQCCQSSWLPSEHHFFLVFWSSDWPQSQAGVLREERWSFFSFSPPLGWAFYYLENRVVNAQSWGRYAEKETSPGFCPWIEHLVQALIILMKTERQAARRPVLLCFPTWKTNQNGFIHLF